MNDQAVETIIKRLVFDTVPERRSELAEMWARFPPSFQLAPDRARFVMEAGPFGVIAFNSRTLRQVWLIGHATWLALEAYSAVLLVLQSTKRPFDLAAVDALEGQTAADHAFAALVEQALELGKVEHPDLFEWPASVPKPEEFAQRPRSNPEKAARDLTAMATAFIFLHENRHVVLAQTGAQLKSPQEEEIDCDLFAVDFILSHVVDYGRESGDDAGLVRQKRACGIVIGLMVLMVITPATLWGATSTHPSMGARLEAVTGAMNLGTENTLFWTYATSALLATLRWAGRLRATPIPFLDPKDLYHSLLKLL